MSKKIWLEGKQLTGSSLNVLRAVQKFPHFSSYVISCLVYLWIKSGVKIKHI